MGPMRNFVAGVLLVVVQGADEQFPLVPRQRPYLTDKTVAKAIAWLRNAVLG